MSNTTVGILTKLPTSDVTFVRELYPRLREDDAAIERYRAAIDRLPPIVVARKRVLVDGYHRWQAYKREGLLELDAEDLGNLTDVEILKESVKRNAAHGHQLETKDKRRMADLLYRQGTKDADELIQLLSITPNTLETYLRDAKKDEKEQQQAKVWDLWLDCLSASAIESLVGITDQTVTNWISKKRIDTEFREPPHSRQHFDVWSFLTADDDAGTPSFFGKLPPQVIENLLWLYTEPGQIIFDPFVGGGTTIDIAKRMGRRVWASDLTPSTPMLPIHQHNICDGWPDDAPRKADFILLDPPYWQQAKDRYSKSDHDLGNMSQSDFSAAWAAIIKTCTPHLSAQGYLAFIISPTQCDDGPVIDHAFEMYRTCVEHNLQAVRRVIVTYNTQQANGQQVEWAREHRQLLKRYRDLIIFTHTDA